MTGQMIDAIGGEAGCLKLATAFYARVATDPELKPLFPGKSLRCATEEFSAFLVQFLGGDEEKTQYRWWLSLRESHARFNISSSQRTAWLNQMELTLRSSELNPETQDALLQFFTSSSAYLLRQESEPVNHPELADRWNQAEALDQLIADIVAGQDSEVLQTFQSFAARPSLFVGILARMLQTHRPELVKAVAQTVKQDPTLGPRQHNGRSLLHHAAGAGSAEIVQLLLSQGIDPNLLDSGNHPPLYRLANANPADANPAIAQMLVKVGADVNHSGGVTRSTPLHMAARQGNVQLAQALLELGASPAARDSKGFTPLDRAINCRKPEVAKVLQKAP